MPASRHVITILLVAGIALAACTAGLCQPPEKKLIEYGWDVPNPSFVAANIEKIEQRPFEGLIMRVPNIGSVFSNKKHSEEQVAGEFAALEQIKWSKFTDNFVIMYAASTMDWFSDEDWECVLHNVGLCAKAVRIGRCKGVYFDAEPYGNNPWHYPTQAHADTKTFAEYQVQARQRGAQFVDRIQQEMPDAVIHTFFLFSYFSGLARQTDLEERDRRLSQQHYALLPAFVNGMLDAAGQDIIITDGNESSYYYTDAQQYFRSFFDMRQTGLGMVAPENRRKYLAQVQCSQALYVDHLMALRSQKYESAHMTPEERARWFQHNVYWALYTCDRYVWLYSEKMNWWNGSELPEGLEGAVVAAKEHLAAGRPLGYDMKEIVTRARQRADEEIRARLGEKTADVPALAQGERPPTIDGNLDDAVWQRVPSLSAFVPFATVDSAPEAGTQTKVAYDRENLYVAMQCAEPDMDHLSLVGSGRDSDVWLGDSVDLFFSAAVKERNPFHHVIVNPDGLCWDARQVEDSTDKSWDPEYLVATAQGADYWTVELAIPWEALEISGPQSGTQLAANVCRQRIPKRELSSWSTCISGFQEPLRFGVWTLK